MAHDERHRSDEHPQAPWWWGIGPVGAALLVVVGVAGALWAFLGSAEDDPVGGYGASKVVAIGAVLLGTAVLERFRSRRSRAQGTEDGQNG
ncbi:MULTISPECIES: hypothetical protein [Streptomyces]|uniref:Integral membrane protein n=2 Tax=Streptomyces TaxID=1883 RepID=A0ABU2RBS2_9ACTN|nr:MULTISPECIES: hypothetical protein [unclassified Streptomyces]MBK3595038.1 hypothetical protein [Streptomyces sp. MBT51]MDT0426305.1 hypothetical protein [Streptomyces sp. DSM 41770]HBF79527.1 hypothetical protein [Streptomyces sp.]